MAQGQEQQASRGTWLAAVLGYACSQAFAFSFFYLGTNSSMDIGPFQLERADLLVSLLCMVACFQVMRHATPRARTLMLRPLVLVAVAALACLVAVLQICLPALPLLPLRSALLGVANAFLLSAWGRALGASPLRYAIPGVFLSTALAAAACLALAAVSLPKLALLLPFGSVACLVALGSAAAEKRGLGGHQEKRQPRDSGPFRWDELFPRAGQHQETLLLTRKVVIGTVAFGVASGFMETYGSDPGMASTPTVFATLLLLVFFCIAALQLVSSRPGGKDLPPQAEELHLDGVYRLALLVMMAGFLFVPVLAQFGVSGEAIELTGYLGLMSVLACLFLVMARLGGLDASQAFAYGFLALFGGEFAGLLLGNLVDVASGLGQTPYVVVALAGLLVLYAFLFLFTDRDFRQLTTIAQQVDRFQAACASLAAQHGLSPRESEILPLALRGRTGERIASELGVSKSTIDTHLRRIYAKTGVHSRQELIDLGERTATDLEE